jgi:hypothetical protein
MVLPESVQSFTQSNGTGRRNEDEDDGDDEV